MRKSVLVLVIILGVNIFFFGKTEAQVLVDSLNGFSVGQVHGGAFSPEGGWTPENWDDMIVYDTGVFIIRGRLEITVRNFDPVTQNSSPRHHILSMYSDGIGDHNHWTYLSGDSSGKSIWNLHTGWHYQGGFKFLSLAGDLIQTYRKDYNNWSLDSTYKFVFIWDLNKVQFYVNSDLIAENIHQWNFALRYIFLGRDYTRATDLETGYPNNEYSAQIGPIYSNLVVYADSVLTPVYPNRLVEYPVWVPEDRDIFSFDLNMVYPPFLLDFHSVEKTQNQNLEVVYAASPGSLKVGGYSPYPISPDTMAALIRFSPRPDSSFLQVAHVKVYNNYFNEDSYPDFYLTYVLYPQDSMKTVPVEWLQFEAVPIDYRSVALSWKTATESENLGFAIERSTDGHSFQQIGFVPGHGTSAVERTYSYIDKDVSEGTYYYRIKQIDYDGRCTYSEIRKITLGVPLRFNLAPVHPNPFRDHTVIGYSVPRDLEGQDIVFQVFDITGRLVAEIHEQKGRLGSHSLIWQARNQEGKKLPSGVYFLVARVANQIQAVRKIVLER